MRYFITAVIASLVFSAAPGLAQTEIDTLSFGRDNAWDGTVFQKRNASSQMVFTDGDVTSATLLDLFLSPDTGISTSAADARYVQIVGDTMTGALAIQGGNVPQLSVDVDAGSGIELDSLLGDSLLYFASNSSPKWEFGHDQGDDRLILYDADGIGRTFEVDAGGGNLRIITGLSMGSEYTFPTTDGTAGQFMQTNGSGTISFASPSPSSTGWTVGWHSVSTTGSVVIDPSSSPTYSLMVDGPISFLGGTGADQYIYFKGGTESMKWDNALDLFYFSDAIRAGNEIIAGTGFSIGTSGPQNDTIQWYDNRTAETGSIGNEDIAIFNLVESGTFTEAVFTVEGDSGSTIGLAPDDGLAWIPNGIHFADGASLLWGGTAFSFNKVTKVTARMHANDYSIANNGGIMIGSDAGPPGEGIITFDSLIQHAYGEDPSTPNSGDVAIYNSAMHYAGGPSGLTVFTDGGASSTIGEDLVVAGDIYFNPYGAADADISLWFRNGSSSNSAYLQFDESESRFVMNKKLHLSQELYSVQWIRSDYGFTLGSSSPEENTFEFKDNRSAETGAIADGDMATYIISEAHDIFGTSTSLYFEFSANEALTTGVAISEGGNIQALGTVYAGNVTVTAEVDAVTLDISGNGDVDGTMDTGDLDVNGDTTLGGELMLASSGFSTLADGDATPDVNQGIVYWSSSTAGVNITDFDAATQGQIIIVIDTNGNTTLIDGATLVLAGSANWTMGATDSITLVYDLTGTRWIELSRSDN